MTTIDRSALLFYPHEKIYALVADIERYPEFLNGCVEATVIDPGPDTVVARLGLSRAGISHGFVTRNTMHPSERIELALVDGPLSISRVIGHLKPWVMRQVKYLCNWILNFEAGLLMQRRDVYSTK